MTMGLILGRFQPLHLGHLWMIRRGIKECDQLILGIGSSQYAYTKRNPFTYKERVKMIPVYEKDNIYIQDIPDLHDYDNWVEHVFNCIGLKPDVVYTGSPITTKLFQEAGVDVNQISIKDDISASKIRDCIAEDDLRWTGLVPESTFQMIHRSSGVDRIRHLYKHTPIIGVDIHGVIDSAPGVVREFMVMLRNTGCELHILSGPPMDIIKVQLERLGIEHELHYDHLFSIVDHLKETGVEMYEKKGMWYTDDEDAWNSAKSDYVRAVGISHVIDDMEEYKATMPEDVRFYLARKCNE